MKIILDESAPQKLRLLIDARHVVVTTWFQGWFGLKNGALLAAAEDAGFDLFITADREIGYQQNLKGRRIALLVLSTNNWGVVKEQVKLIVEAIESATPGCYAFLDIGHGRGLSVCVYHPGPSVFFPRNLNKSQALPPRERNPIWPPPRRRPQGAILGSNC